MADILQKDHKFIATQTHNHIINVEQSHKQLRKTFQDFITEHMSVSIIYIFKIIYIKHHHPASCIGISGCKVFIDQFFSEKAVIHSGQRIFLGTFLKKFFLQLLPGDISGASYEIMISGIFILCYKSPYCQKTRITVFIDTPHFYRPAFPGCQKIRQKLPVVFINIAVFLSTGLKIRNIFYRSQVFIQTFIYVRLLTVLKKLQCSISINASVFFQCIPNIKNGIFFVCFHHRPPREFLSSQYL